MLNSVNLFIVSDKNFQNYTLMSKYVHLFRIHHVNYIFTKESKGNISFTNVSKKALNMKYFDLFIRKHKK